MREHPAEHGVLVHVGEVAGMEGVAVVHGRGRMRRVSIARLRSELSAIDVLAAGFANW